MISLNFKRFAIRNILPFVLLKAFHAFSHRYFDHKHICAF